MQSLALPLNVRGAPYASDSSGWPWLSIQQLRCHVKPEGRQGSQDTRSTTGTSLKRVTQCCSMLSYHKQTCRARQFSMCAAPASCVVSSNAGMHAKHIKHAHSHQCAQACHTVKVILLLNSADPKILPMRPWLQVTASQGTTTGAAQTCNAAPICSQWPPPFRASHKPPQGNIASSPGVTSSSIHG